MDSSRGFLLSVVALLLAASAFIVLPYLEYFTLAVVLAYVLAPVQRRLQGRLGPRATAGLLAAVTTLAVVVPLVFVTRAVAADAVAIAEAVQSGEAGLGDVEAFLADVLGVQVNLTGLAGSAASDGGVGAVGSLLDVFGTLTHVAAGLGLTLFLLYYFLKDGERFFAWLRWVVPLPDDVQDDLYEAIDHITGAVLAGHVLVAVVQGVLAGVGLLLTGVPNAMFWTVVMVVLSLLPIVGSFLVWGPAAAYLFLVGQTVPAVALVVYGTVVVGVSDDYLRPIVVDRYAEVNPSVIILGVLGGLTAMGPIGIFVGPIVIGALRATLDVYRNEFDPVEDERTGRSASATGSGDSEG